MYQRLQFWKHMSIRHKLFSWISVIIIFMSMITLFLNHRNSVIIGNFNQAMTRYYTIHSLLVETRQNKAYLNRYLKELQKEDLELYINSSEYIRHRISELADETHTKEGKFSMKAIQNSVRAYQELWDEAIEERESHIETYYNKLYKGDRISKYTESYIQDLLLVSLREGKLLYQGFAKDAERMKKLSVLVIIALSLFSLIVGIIFSHYLVKPIRQLAKASEKISTGELDIEDIYINSQDEVGVMANSFNIMSKNIRSYVEDLEQKVVIEKKLHEEEMRIIKMEQLLKEAQFQALQSQINPHFLFNTLNAISRTALFEEADDTQRLIQALAHILRYRVKSSKEMISLSEEIEMIKEYMYIQKFRFGNRISIEFNLPDDISHIKVPVFMIQPIVENAIIHGLEPKVEGGHLTVTVNKDRESMKIIVKDTGVGMTPDKIEELLTGEVVSDESIGVSNVFRRFKFVYGELGRFLIESEIDKGTVITFSIELGEEERTSV